MVPYAAGGRLTDTIRVANLKAVVAIAPWGGAVGAWGKNGPAGVTAPLLLIAGDRDHTVDYATGARAFFDGATNSSRYLLTYHGGGHALGGGLMLAIAQDLRVAEASARILVSAACL